MRKLYLIHEKAMVNLEKIKKMAIEIHGPLTFEVNGSPSGETATKFYELHIFQKNERDPALGDVEEQIEMAF